MSDAPVIVIVIERLNGDALTYEVKRSGHMIARGTRSECLIYVQGYIKALTDVGNVVFGEPDIRNGIQTYRATWYGALM